MTITSTQLKQNTYLLDNVKKEDIIITKRDRPFAVILDIERYDKLVNNQPNIENKEKILKKVRGILDSSIDPVAWQKSLREENDSTLYGEN